MREIVLYICFTFAVTMLTSCGDDKSRDERAREAQRAIQEGSQKERQLYEGMQKQTEGLEKKPAEQKTKN
jgi:hypothetical protein